MIREYTQRYPFITLYVLHYPKNSGGELRSLETWKRCEQKQHGGENNDQTW